VKEGENGQRSRGKERVGEEKGRREWGGEGGVGGCEEVEGGSCISESFTGSPSDVSSARMTGKKTQVQNVSGVFSSSLL